jgi:hypothetical protein
MSNLVNFNYTSLENYSLQFKPTTRPLMSWRKEILNTVKLIDKSTTKPLVLCFSGGIDSEIIALALIESKINFSVLTVKHKNEHDTKYAEFFCQQHNLKQTIIEIDAEKFYTEGIKKYIQQGYKAVRLFRYFQLFLLETLEEMGVCGILGSGEQVYCNVNGEICINMDYGYMISLDWCKNNNATHYPYFFMHNPELYASYMKIDFIKEILKHPLYFTNHKDNKSAEKMIVSHANWNMGRRDKFHGFEYLQHIKIPTETNLRKNFPNIIPKYFPIKTIKEQLGI